MFQLSLTWENVYKTWRLYYYSNDVDGAKNAFNDFFDHKRFFALNSETTNIPLSLGRYKKTKHIFYANVNNENRC